MKKKVSRKKPVTPRSRVKNAIRQLWLRSRERAQAIKDQSNTCAVCHRKGSEAKGRVVKIQVHHKDGIDWDGVVDLVIERVLQTPDRLQCLCVDCHDRLHAEEKAQAVMNTVNSLSDKIQKRRRFARIINTRSKRT